jgi:hypothetical protein
MMKHLSFLALGAATLACSGRYYEVGDMNATGGNRGAAGGAAPGGNSSATAGASEPGPIAGTTSAGPAMPADGACVPSGAPVALTGPFAEPSVIWDRITLLTWGNMARTAPTKFPATTTLAWVDGEVTRAFQTAKTSLGAAPGAELFLRQALRLDSGAAFSQHWSVLAATDNTLLNALLRAPLGDQGRVGIFTEPSWLERRTTISARGEGIEDVLFGRPVPPPPEGITNPEPNPNLSDRANLEAAVASNVVCMGCHLLMDPTGFALGNFAADGAYRELDHGLPVDTASSRRSGMYPEEVIAFDGIADFGQKFESDCWAIKGIASTFVRSAAVVTGSYGNEVWELSEPSIAPVQQAFMNSDRTYQDLVRAYMQSPAGVGP